jgi:hypothetical protein
MKLKQIKSLAKIQVQSFSYLEFGQVFWTKEIGLCIKVHVSSSSNALAINLRDGKERTIFSMEKCHPIKCMLQHEPYPT